MDATLCCYGRAMAYRKVWLLGLSQDASEHALCDAPARTLCVLAAKKRLPNEAAFFIQLFVLQGVAEEGLEPPTRGL